MSHDSDKPVDRDAELRDTILKSSFTGVAATVFAVVVCSPAGLGGMIGTSVAGLGWNSLDPNNTGKDVVAFPTATPLSQVELQDIRLRLTSTSADLDNMRAATDAEIEYIRAIADSDNVLAFSAAPTTVATVVPRSEVDPNAELAQLLLQDSPS